MADVQANILIQTTGGDDSAAEINKATSALQNVTAASSGMEGQFQHRFQHIGLMLFAGDALRASGLGMETRQVIGGLNTALIAGESAFGAAAGPALLFLAVLTAIAGIAIKVIQHHKDEADALAKLADQQTKAYEGYEKEADTIKEIQANSSGLSGTMLAWLNADKAVADHLKSDLLVTLGQEQAALEKQRAAIQRSADIHAQLVKAVDSLKAAFDKLISPVTSLVSHFQALASAMTSLIPTMTQHVVLNDKQKLQYEELTAAIAKNRAQQEMLANEGTTDAQKVADATKKEHEEIEKSWEKMAETISKGEKTQADMIMKLHKEIADDQKKQLEEQAQTAKAVSDRIGSTVGDAFGRMLVKGESFTDAMKQAFQQMAEQIIANIVKMIIEWELLTALGFPVGGTAGGLGSILGFATGGSAYADTPTLAMFGESGPEVATFTPLSGGGGNVPGGGGDNTQVNNVTVNVQGGLIDQKTLDTIGRSIVSQIRGQGQINFVRA